MPAIKPNLLLIDADVAADERASSMMADMSSQLMLARDCCAAFKILSEQMIDLIILDRNVIARRQQLASVVAQFHQIKNRHDVPVLITCGAQRSGVTLKTHPWGVAYHVPRSIASTVMTGLIHGSLTLKVGYGSNQHRIAAKPSMIPSPVPKPRGLRLPEVVMPPHAPSNG